MTITHNITLHSLSKFKIKEKKSETKNKIKEREKSSLLLIG